MSSHPPFFANAQVMALDPAEIFVPDRIGFYHEDKATALGRLIAVDGQRDPIKVQPRKGNQPWKLVTGLHRLRGCEMEGIQVYALEVQGQAEDLADLEASENLHRRPLGPIERAKFTAALVQAAQDRIAREHGDLKQHQLGAKARWQRVKDKETTADQVLQQEADDAADKMSAAYSWQESVADALGLDRRTIRRDLSLFRLLIEPFPDLIEALAKHPVVGENARSLRWKSEVRSVRLPAWRDQSKFLPRFPCLARPMEHRCGLSRSEVYDDRPRAVRETHFRAVRRRMQANRDCSGPEPAEARSAERCA